jgi:hypothetical protein
VTYEGACHGFMRAGEAPDANQANKKARDELWVRWKDFTGLWLFISHDLSVPIS